MDTQFLPDDRLAKSEGLGRQQPSPSRQPALVPVMTRATTLFPVTNRA